MSRTPSMTTEQAELILGTRGFLHVSADNRSTVRKWLVAQGFPALFVGGLSMAELAIAYNQTDGSGLDKLRKKLIEAKEVAADTETVDTEDSNATVESTVETAAQSSTSGPDVNRVAVLLTELLSRPSGVDPEKVNAIIDSRWNELPELIRKHSTVTRIEIVNQEDNSTRTVDGHCHETLPDLIQAMSSRQPSDNRHPNIMMVGPTGSGKTHGFHQACKALGLESFTNGAISMDHQLIGFRDANGNYHETPFRKAFGRPAGYLFDEFDSSDNGALLCLAGAMANGGFDFPDLFVERHPNSCIVAAGNTWGLGATADFVGRNKIDGALRSRFPVRIQWDIDEKLERAFSGNVNWACRVQKARANAKRAGLKVIIDTRVTQAGAALIASGWTDDKAAKFTYLADLSAEQQNIVEAA